MSGKSIVLRAVLLLCLAGAPAFACPDDGDGDGICDGLDNCPAVANASQSDIDGDLAGDACDDADAALALTVLQLKTDTSASSDNGSVKVKGTVSVTPPNDVLFFSGGLRLRLQDALGFDATYAFGQAECGMVALGRWICLSGDHRTKASFKALKPTPTTSRFTIVFKHLALAGSFGGPVTATMSQDYDVDRVGTIGSCRVSPTKLACKAL
jgi:hypothetical protein